MRYQLHAVALLDKSRKAGVNKSQPGNKDNKVFEGRS